MTKDDIYHSFYLEVYGTILHGVENRINNDLRISTDIIHIFLDTDNETSTGYRVKSLGAEYVLEVQGYDNYIYSTKIKKFDTNRDQNDWNGWVKTSTSINTNLMNDCLEIQIPTNALECTKNGNGVLALFHIQDQFGNQDFSYVQ